jgi:hypothetical protein
MTSEIDKLKHFHIEDYSGIYFTDELNATQIIDCVEVEISPDNWIMAVDINNTNLLLLNAYYNIQWKECSCLRGIRLEDVTVELEKEAYEEMRHN